MAQVLPNTTTTNNYTDTVLGMSGFYQDGSITIANNPVSILLRKRSKDPGSPYDTEYTYVSPNTIPIVAGDKEWIVGLQIKSAIAGSPAQVFGWLQEPGTAGFAPGTPFTQTINASGSIGVANFLGSFTQAQWPPKGGTAAQGDVAILADTYGGATFQWVLEFRPDIDSTYPWRPYNGSTPSIAALDNTQTGVNPPDSYYNIGGAAWAYLSGAGTGAPALTFAVPVAGVWTFRAQISNRGLTPGNSFGAGISTTNTIAPVAANYTLANVPASGDLAVSSPNVALTLSKGANAYAWGFNGTATVPFGEISEYPTKIANA